MYKRKEEGKEDRKKGGDLQRVQNCAKFFREGPRKTIALLHESSCPPPALSFKAKVWTGYTSAASLQADSHSCSDSSLPLSRQEAAARRVTGSHRKSVIWGMMLPFLYNLKSWCFSVSNISLQRFLQGCSQGC